MIPKHLQVGVQPIAELAAQLRAAGMGTNPSAELLLNAANLRPESQPLQVTLQQIAVGDLQLDEPATVPRIIQSAEQRGLHLCPPTTAIYLRLAYLEQPASSAPIHAHRAPVGSITVMSSPLDSAPDFPRGFYLRLIDGQPCLRGYHCSDDYVWHDDDQLVFASSIQSTNEKE
jgi:hypothetical protein